MFPTMSGHGMGFMCILSPRKEEEAKGDVYLEGARKAWFYLFMVLAPWQEAV